MSLGDTFAALVGRKFGKVAFFNKTFEGFLGGLLPCVIIAFYFNSLPFYVSLIGAFSAMLIEVVPIPIDDNLSIPVFSASAMTISSGII
jgi:glycerol-3-phosphate acyltransferase PlsY